MRLYANLHSHSTHSDGVYTPSELVKIAHDEGYKALALSDHDTVTGNAEIKAECAKYGMETIFAAEFTVNEGYHIVAMDFDPDYPKMKTYLEGMSFRETDQTRILFERGLKEGFLHDITWQNVLDDNAGITWICNEQVFRSMKKRGLAVDKDYPAFFENVFGVHRGEVPPSFPFLDAVPMIRLIREAGGIAIHAHPQDQLKDAEKLVSEGLAGIEVWHSMLSPAERNEALALAETYDLFVSGGSDHEGICGGQYARLEEPEKSPWYAPPCTLGTTEYFFRELKERRLFPDRRTAIHTAMEFSR